MSILELMIVYTCV